MRVGGYLVQDGVLEYDSLVCHEGPISSVVRRTPTTYRLLLAPNYSHYWTLMLECSRRDKEQHQPNSGQATFFSSACLVAGQARKPRKDHLRWCQSGLHKPEYQDATGPPQDQSWKTI